MLKHAIPGEQVKVILVELGFTPNPDPFVCRQPFVGNEERARIDAADPLEWYRTQLREPPL
jgi:hypothetical protein